MPGLEQYTFTGMTLMKRGDGAAKERVIDAVRFQYSTDGKTWNWYEEKQYVKTGQTAADKETVERKFEIDPPFSANKVRVWIDKSHANTGWYQGRFDLWAVKALKD